MVNDLVTVGIYRTVGDAAIDRITLESRGIRVFVENENYQLWEGASWPAEGVTLTVPRDQAARAREILSSGDDVTDR